MNKQYDLPSKNFTPLPRNMTSLKADIATVKDMSNQYLSITGQVKTNTLPMNTALSGYKVISSSVSNMPLQCRETAVGEVECDISWD
jgi:hypothetical protein